MAWKVDERIPKDLFIKLMIEKANIIKDHLKNSLEQLIIVVNIGPTMAVFKFYDLKEEDSLKLCMTLSNLGDIDEQISVLWQQVNFLLQQYCSQCQGNKPNVNKVPDVELLRLSNKIHTYLIETISNTKYHINAIDLCYISCKMM